MKEEKSVSDGQLQDLDYAALRRLKRKGFSDKRLAQLLNVSEKEVREHRYALKLHPVYKRVDTCAAEFATETAYLYSTYEEECESRPSDRKKVMILGGGRTASVRASSLTTAAFTPHSPCANRALKRLWSTATPKPCPPTSTPATASISSR